MSNSNANSPGSWMLKLKKLQNKYKEYLNINKKFLSGIAPRPVSLAQWHSLKARIKNYENAHNAHLLEMQRPRLPSYPHRRNSSVGRSKKRSVSRRAKSA